MITNRIGRHEVLLPINHNYRNLCCFNARVFATSYFLKKTTRLRTGSYFSLHVKLKHANGEAASRDEGGRKPEKKK